MVRNNSFHRVAFLSAILLLLTCACSDSSKSKRIQVTNPPRQEADLDKPYAEVYLSLPADVADKFLRMLRAEIDDGEFCYVVSGDDFSCVYEAGQSWQNFCSPKINTPDSGSVVFRFSLVDVNGTILVCDTSGIDLREDWHWMASLMFDEDISPCRSLSGAVKCRSYEIPLPLKSVQPPAFVLWSAWGGNNLANSIMY